MELNFQEKGRAALQVDWVFKKSTVTGAYATSPMKLLTPRSRGQYVCSYSSNFGGGLLAGDQTRLDLRVGRQARCFLGTQASTKVYRNPLCLPCSHITRATLGADALLVFAPAPVQPFANSLYDQRQEFRLGPEASLVLLDWFTSGRAACGERWAFERLSMRNEVWQTSAAELIVDGRGFPEENSGSPKENTTRPHERCVFLDSCCLDSRDGHLNSPHRTGRFNCFALLLMVGTALKKQAEQLLEDVRGVAVKARPKLLVSASPLREGVVMRVAGEDVADIDHHLRRYLSQLANLLGEDPWSRRF